MGLRWSHCQHPHKHARQFIFTKYQRQSICLFFSVLKTCRFRISSAVSGLLPLQWGYWFRSPHSWQTPGQENKWGETSLCPLSLENLSVHLPLNPLWIGHATDQWGNNGPHCTGRVSRPSGWQSCSRQREQAADWSSEWVWLTERALNR